MYERFEVSRTPLEGLYEIRRKPIGDHRGYLCRLFDAPFFGELGFKKSVAQVNHTLTRRRGTVRGMHFQYPPYSEMKLVCCLRGKVWDVAVDIRKYSPTFLKWHALELTPENNVSILIPEGFAHGFQALRDDCELLYLHSANYVPKAEGGLHVNDPTLGIAWPIEITEISERDQNHPLLGEHFEGIVLADSS